MDKSFEVVWAKTAETDLTKIVTYIAQDSPLNALKVLQEIKAEVSTLYISPEHCRVVPELYAQGITLYRDMIVNPWRIIYRIDNSKVFVLSVLDSRQNVEDILLNRLI